VNATVTNNTIYHNGSDGAAAINLLSVRNSIITDNLIFNNLSGGINLGQGEFAPGYIQGSVANAPPGSCLNDPSIPANVELPYCENKNVNIHHNYVSLNSSIGDELFSATPAGAGGVSICTGADYYKFNFNWVCGNLSSGDGGGVGHVGFSYYGDIEHNTILFNQSLNPTIPANGGGLVVMGTPDADVICNSINPNLDQDCVPNPLNSVGPSDGMGPGLIINGNLIMGNAAEAGSGGGLRFQNVNGAEVIAFPTDPSKWYSASVTNNIIANNVAGWDGAGVSLLDALNVNLINNTIVSNSTTASAGILFTTIGAPLASSSGANCMQSATTSCPQVAGLVSIQNSAVFSANLPGTVVCPAGHGNGGTGADGLTNGYCRSISYPVLDNNLFWQNSTYYIGVGALSPQFQQNVVSLYNAFTTTPAASQTFTGACTSGTSYWDIGVRGDTGPSMHDSTFQLAPRYSVLTDANDYPGLNNLGTNPSLAGQYCDGSRTPPEFKKSGWAVPPGISDATVPNPIFNLTPVATVDEGNNWINLRWGPLSMDNPVTGSTLANYSLAPGSPAIDYIPTSSPTFNLTPKMDFFGKQRPDPSNPNAFDVGAIEFTSSGGANPPILRLSSISPNTGLRDTIVPVALAGTNLSGATAVVVSGTGITCAIIAPAPTDTTVNANCSITAFAPRTARTVKVVTPGGTTNLVSFTVQGSALNAIARNPRGRGRSQLP